jgi:uncharacterized protein YuzE
MKFAYDARADLLSLEFHPGVPIADFTEAFGMTFEYAADRSIVAIGILNASRRIARDALNLIASHEGGLTR